MTDRPQDEPVGDTCTDDGWTWRTTVRAPYADPVLSGHPPMTHTGIDILGTPGDTPVGTSGFGWGHPVADEEHPLYADHKWTSGGATEFVILQVAQHITQVFVMTTRRILTLETGAMALAYGARRAALRMAAPEEFVAAATVLADLPDSGPPEGRYRQHFSDMRKAQGIASQLFSLVEDTGAMLGADHPGVAALKDVAGQVISHAMASGPRSYGDYTPLAADRSDPA